MITIATFGRQQDADVARSRIEAAGISVFTPDEAVGGFLGYEAPIVAGVRLQVADTDVQRATEILQEVPEEGLKASSETSPL